MSDEAPIRCEFCFGVDEGCTRCKLYAYERAVARARRFQAKVKLHPLHVHCNYCGGTCFSPDKGKETIPCGKCNGVGQYIPMGPIC